MPIKIHIGIYTLRPTFFVNKHPFEYFIISNAIYIYFLCIKSMPSYPFLFTCYQLYNQKNFLTVTRNLFYVLLALHIRLEHMKT